MQKRGITALLSIVLAASLCITPAYGTYAKEMPTAVVAETGTRVESAEETDVRVVNIDNDTDIVMAQEEASVNATTVNLYYISDWAEETVGDLPSDKPTSFQLQVTGASKVTYSLPQRKNYIDVSTDGTISLHTWYRYKNNPTDNFYYTSSNKPEDESKIIGTSYRGGSETVRITADGKTINVTVNIIDYSDEYAEKLVDDYIAANIKSSMTVEEKLNAICAFVAEKPYNGYYQSWKAAALIGGDCWASTNLIIYMAEKIGLEATSRNGNKDPGAGSGHRNALVYAGNDIYYECEAGYGSSATPRPYNVTKRTSLFCYKVRSTTNQAIVYQYDGGDCDTLEIPSQIDGYTVAEIGDYFARGSGDHNEIILPSTITTIGKTAFYNSGITSINIPKNVTSIKSEAFSYNPELDNFTSSSTNYPIKDGVLYNSDYSEIVCAPAAAITSIPTSVAKIDKSAFYGNENLTTLYIPSSVKTIEESAFCNTSLIAVDIASDGITSIPTDAFYINVRMKRMRIPATVTEFASNAISMGLDATIYAPAGSAAETYAQNINYSCDNVLSNFDEHEVIVISGKAATCTESGITDGKKCGVCGEILETQKVIPATGHTEVVLAAKAATCTESGLTEGKKCSVCGEILTAQKVIPATGHTEVVLAAKAATCTESGLTEGKKCSTCGEILTEQKVIPATDHTEVVLAAKAATCTESGLTEGKKCSTCGEILTEQKVIPAIDHTWDNGVIT